MQPTRKQQSSNAVNQNREATTAAEAEIESFLDSYRAGNVRGAVITFIGEDGKEKHMLLGSLAENLSAAMDQVKSLDVALSRRFFSGD